MRTTTTRHTGLAGMLTYGDPMARHYAHAAGYESACIVCRARFARTGRPMPEYRRRRLAELETRGYVATIVSRGGSTL